MARTQEGMTRQDAYNRLMLAVDELGKVLAQPLHLNADEVEAWAAVEEALQAAEEAWAAAEEA